MLQDKPELRDKIIYIAGRMRNMPQNNHPAFFAAEQMAIHFGFAKVFNPAQMDRDDEQNQATTDEEHTANSPIYCKRDVEALLQCTHIAMLPDWENSIGASAEYHIAKWLGLTILDAETFEPLDGTGKRAELMEFHRKTCTKALQVMRAKNHDYGASDDPFANFRRTEALGICTAEQSFLVRWTDKLSRIATFISGKGLRVKDETVEDTIVDSINYPILFLAYRKFGK